MFGLRHETIEMERRYPLDFLDRPSRPPSKILLQIQHILEFEFLQQKQTTLVNMNKHKITDTVNRSPR